MAVYPWDIHEFYIIVTHQSGNKAIQAIYYADADDKQE